MTKIAILLGIILTSVSIAEKILNMYISWRINKKKMRDEDKSNKVQL